jgi:3-methyladenine DNA glycosylase/8-oxoguanine DNA glycosylase
MILRSRYSFSLRDLAFSHGWIALRPWSWQADPPALCRVERLPSGVIVSLQITSAEPDSPTDEFHMCASAAAGVEVPRGPDPHGPALARLSAEDRASLERRVRWMLRLEEDFSDFHALLRTLAGCERPAAQGEGRLLRSWSFTEDAIKTICTTNTTWSQTQSMIARLVDRYGERGQGGTAFPDPERLAAVPEAELRECGLGYRAAAVRRLAETVAAGELPREASEWAALPSPDLHQRLLALRGIGPYAAANLLMLLGHYDRLALDSWLRRCVRDAWFDGAPVGDREIEARFVAFGPWRALIYWFHPALHPGRDAWRRGG